MTQKKGDTTRNLEVAVEEGTESKSPKARALFQKIMRNKLIPDEEAEMPSPKTKKKVKKAEHKDEIEQLRTDIRSLRKQMKSLDGALRKEQSEKVAKARAVLVKKLKTATMKLAKWSGKKLAIPFVKTYGVVRHPIESAKTVKKGLWRVGSTIAVPFKWLAASRYGTSDEAAAEA